MPTLTALYGPYGLLGIALAAVGLLLCLAYAWRPRPLVPWIAVAALLVSAICAHLHSTLHVARIGVERAAPAASEEEAFSYAKLLEARGEDVAAVRYAEDTQDDRIDRAGLDEADLAFLDSRAESQPAMPAGPADDSAIEEVSGAAEPILVDETTFALAHQLDRWNLNLTKLLLALAALLVGHDYLRRFNNYPTASFPLPLPSSLPNSITPLPAVVTRPDPPRRTLPQEAAWLARRGDPFLLLTSSPETARAAARLLDKAPRWRRPKTLVHLTGDKASQVSDQFIFESLWFGRGSFLIDDPARTRTIVDSLVTNLATRRAHRARVRQSVHLIWDLEDPVPQALVQLAQPTGLSVLVPSGRADKPSD